MAEERSEAETVQISSNQDEGEVVAVGSISHVLKTAFREFFPPPPVVLDLVQDEETEPIEIEAVEPEEPVEIEAVEPEEPVEPHPYVKAGQERIQKIHQDLEAKHQVAKELLSFLDQCRDEAKEKDEQEALRLQEQGLIVKAHIPIGPSNLKIDREAAGKFGHFGSNLVFARDFFQEKHEKMLDQSGNGPSAQLKASKYVSEEPGYLKGTHSLAIRTELAKEQYSETIKSVKEREAALPKTGSSISTSNSSKKKGGAPLLTGDQKHENKQILDRMQHKLEFLRNPRFDQSPKSSGTKLLCSVGDTGYFSVSPPELLFEDYESGGIYQQTLTLKNICYVTRRLRILPLATEFFSIHQISFPDDSGFIAPGMSCRLTIRFAPDTPSDFQDVIVAETEGGTFEIKVLAKREPPILSIPQTIHVGNCLVGGDVTTTLNCLNSGGKARFWLVEEALWPSSSESLGTDEPILEIPPFKISPTTFELDTGEAMDFSIQYAPKHIDSDHVKFVMVCDNCQVKTFTLTGTGCEVLLDITSLQGQSVAKPVGDIAPLDVIKFDSLTPGSSEMKQLEIFNQTPLEVSYKWNLSDTDGFSVTPQQGVFGSGAGVSFNFEFQPTQVDSYSILSRLEIVDIPICAIRGNDQYNLLQQLKEEPLEFQLPRKNLSAFEIQLLGTGRVIQLDLSPDVVIFNERLYTGQVYKKEITVQNPTRSNSTVTWGQYVVSSIGFEQTIESDEYRWPIDDDFKPTNEACCLSISPTSAVIPANGQLVFELTVNPQRMGEYDAWIQCQVQHNPHPLEIFIELQIYGPSIKFLQPHVDFGLVAVCGTAEQTLMIQNNSGIDANWDLSRVNGQNEGGQLIRSNSSESVASRFSITSRTSSNKGSELPPFASLQFSPPSGTLSPNEIQQIRVTCTAGRKPQRLRSALECSTSDASECRGETSYISVRGEIQSPLVYVSTTEMDLGTTFLGMTVIRTVELINISNLAGKFTWSQPGGSTGGFTIEFTPETGILKSKEKLNIQIRYTARAPGKIETLCCCKVVGMLHPLGFQINTVQRGLVLCYSILDEKQDPPMSLRQEYGECANIEPPVHKSLPKLDFGQHVALFERTTVRLLIRNYSGIEGRLTVDAKKYPACIPSSDLAPATSMSSLGSSSSSSSFGSPIMKTRQIKLLGDQHEQTELYTSAAGLDYVRRKHHLLEDRSILKNGGGVAFLVEPRRFTIPPWDQVVVTVTCFNDMPGKYVDTIVCIIEGMPPMRLSATINVQGCPLSFDKNCVGMDMSKPQPVLSWGQVPFRSKAIVKSFTIINTGPIDTRLKWKVKPVRDSMDDIAKVSLNVDSNGLVNVSVGPILDDDVSLPFEIEPAVQVIKNRSKATFRVTYEPADQVSLSQSIIVADAEWLHPTPIKPKGTKTTTTASTTSLESGNMSTSSSNVSLKSSMSRAFRTARVMGSINLTPQSNTLEKESLGCLKANLICRVVTPELSLDKKIKGRIKFVAWSTHPAQHPTHSRSFALVNRMETTLVFRLQVNGPFSIVQCTSLVPQHPLSLTSLDSIHRSQSQSSYMFSLPPGESVELEIVFLPSTFVESASSRKKNPLETTMEGQLLASFVNGHVQSIPLFGQFLRPMIVISPSEYDFGTVHISRSRQIRLYLSNPTQVDAEWKIQHRPVPIPHTRAQKAAAELALKAKDEPQVFEISISNGKLNGPTLPLGSAGYQLPLDGNRTAEAVFSTTGRADPFEIVVTFHPREEIRYKCRFHVDVRQGSGFDFVLEGCGTLEETGHRPADRPSHVTKHFDHSDFIYTSLK